MNDAELLKKASKAAQSDEKLKALVRKIEDGEADFQDMAVYSERLSKLIGSVLADEGADAEAAEKVMQEYYRHINAKEAKVQAALDRKANLHIRPQKAKFPAERVRQAAQSLEDKTVEQEVIERRARNAVANIANSFHDDYIQENAYFRSNAGLRCYVARIGASKCCAWCAEVAGRFEVGSEPSDFWRRHDNCTCQISYENNKVRQRLSGQGKGWKVDSQTQRRRAQRIQYKPATVNPEQARELETRKLSQYRGLTNSGGNDIIKEQNKKAITQITDSAIFKVRKVQISGFSDEQCKLIQQLHQELLETSRDKNAHKEVAFVLDDTLGNKKVFMGEDDKLDFGMLYGHDLFIMHNHPRNSSYSATDIIFVLQHSEVSTLTIVKNNGAVEILKKTSDFNTDELQKDFRRILKKTVKAELDSEYASAVKKFLEKHSKEGGGLEWKK